MQCRCPSFFFFPQKRQRLGSKDLRGEMSLLHHFPSCLGFSERGVQWNPTPVATFSSERDTHRAWDRLSVQRCRVASQLCNLTHLLHRVHPYKYTDTEKKQNTKGGGAIRWNWCKLEWDTSEFSLFCFDRCEVLALAESPKLISCFGLRLPRELPIKRFYSCFLSTDMSHVDACSSSNWTHEEIASKQSG